MMLVLSLVPGTESIQPWAVSTLSMKKMSPRGP